MPENTKDKLKRELRELEGKNIAHYSVLLQAWIETKMVRDKTLVTLSAGGIGLLVTLLTTVGVQKQIELYLYGGAFVGFVCTIWSALSIYQKNSQLIENEIKGTSSHEIRLRKYDIFSLWAFCLAVTCAFLIGISSAYIQLSTLQEEKMAKDKETTAQGRKDIQIHSLNGIDGLRPTAGTQTGGQPQGQGDQGGQSSSQESSGSSSEGDGESGK